MPTTFFTPPKPAVEFATILDHAKSIHSDLEVAMTAAAAAGKVIVDGFGKIHTIDQKGVGDFVSEVDRLADQECCGILADDSSLTILSEELHPSIPEGVDEFWIVDPLDATSAFLMQAGRQHPAVLISRYKDGQAVLGVGYFPLTGEWFYGYQGLGGFKDTAQLKIPEADFQLQEVWVKMNQYGDSQYETEAFTILRDRLRTNRGARMVTTTVPNSGVALRVAECNTGLGAAIHDNQSKKIKQAPWDIAPVKVILEEAGGVFVNLAGKPVDPFVAEVSIIARNQSLANQIIALLD